MDSLLPSKKKRTENFKPDEERILVSLVKKYKDIVESKKTDAVTNSQKLKTWQTIAEEYVNICGDLKSVATLRTKFNNLKKTTKKKFAEEKKSISRTGGGPAEIFVKISDTENEIRGMLGDTLTGHSSRYDDDHDYMHHHWPQEMEYDNSTDGGDHVTIEFIEDNAEESTKQIPHAEESTEQIPSHSAEEHDFQPAQQIESGQTQKGLSGNTFVSADWSIYTPAKLQQSKSDELKFTKRGSNSNIQQKISSWALSKSELAEQHTKAFWEKHRMELAHMKEKHEQTLRIEQEEWELKRQHMKELHEHILKYKK